MTRDDLKAKLTPIVCDLTLTDEQRQAKLVPHLQRLFDQEKSNAVVYDTWNGVMAEIAEENNLRRH